jgi:hypothetical protein
MENSEWNQADSLDFDLDFPVSPLLDMGGGEDLEPLLLSIESLAEDLRPDKMSVGTSRRKLKYSRSKLRELLLLPESTFEINSVCSFMLHRSRPPRHTFDLSSFNGKEGVRFRLSFLDGNLSYYREAGKEQERADQLVSLVRRIASHYPLCYGRVHSSADFYLGYEESNYVHGVPRQIQTVCWLNLYGKELVERIGRERVLSTPAWYLEELPHGSVLFLTRPTPADFDSEEARLAQARALVHLRPELKLEEVLTHLRKRSLAFVPLAMQFDPDVAPLLELFVKDVELSKHRQEIERFNQYHPPPVTEWLPASQLYAPDVEDVAATAQLYEHKYAEELVVILHKYVPSIFKPDPDALPQIDYNVRLWKWAAARDRETVDILARALGAYLGMVLVHRLGGRWVPRRNLEESAVVVGSWAWLPFLRGRHHVQSIEAAVDYSLTQFFNYARRMRDSAWAPPPLRQ